MATSSSRRIKVALASGATLVVCAAIGAAIISSKPDHPPLSQDVLAAVPAESYKVAVAPPGEQWWTALTSLLPADSGLKELNVFDSEIGIQALGYAEYPGEDAVNGSPARLLVVDTHSNEDAEALARWFDEQDGAQSRNGLVRDSVVSFTDSAHVPMEQVSGFAREGFTPPEGVGTMWLDLAKDLSHGGDKNLASEIMPAALGYTSDAQSILTSEDGRLWKGTWVSGGHSVENVKFDEVEEKLEDAQERRVVVDTSATGASQDPSLTLVSGGATDVLPAMLVSDHGAERSLGLLNPESQGITVSNTASGDVTALFDRRALNTYLFDEEWRAEPNAYVSYGLSAKGVELAYN